MAMIPDSRYFDDDPNDHTHPQHFCPFDTVCSACKHKVESHGHGGCGALIKTEDGRWGACGFYAGCKRSYGRGGY